MIKVGLAQRNFWVGDIKGNTRRIIESIHRAQRKKIDLIVFPELAIVGYPPQDLLLKKHFIKDNLAALDTIKKAAQDIIAVVGFVYSDKNNNIYNAYAFIQNGKILDIYCKINLPNYGVFDEKRYFKPGRDISTYSTKGFTFSVNICEDIWRKDYINLLVDKKLDFIVSISASPFYLGKLSLRKEILSYVACKVNCFVFYCNLIGGQDDLIFDGVSLVVSPQGKVIKFAKRFKEDFIAVELPSALMDISKRDHLSLLKDSLAKTVFDALILGIKDYVRKNGFYKVVVGVSGGIDSAVVVSLAAAALGKNNVYGLIMPSKYTSKGTFSDAVKICQTLKVKHSVVAIDNIFHSYIVNLKPLFKNQLPDETEENIQARIRGDILMAFSNKFGYMVINTGNKSELSCGYCTLYGDLVGGFGVLSDIPKNLVYKLARYINTYTKKKIIPMTVIKRFPSAELRFNQKDSDALPSYDILDPILKLYIEKDASLDEIISRGFERELIKKVIRMVDKNEYKRRQAPPGIKITPREIGRAHV